MTDDTMINKLKNLQGRAQKAIDALQEQSPTLNRRRVDLRNTIRLVLKQMAQAEHDGDDAKMLGAAKNIEHLAQELRKHAEEHGL